MPHAPWSAVPLEGHWFDRTREWMARRRNGEFESHDFATKYLVELSPLPAFRDLTPEAYREKVTALIREIEDDAARDRVRATLWAEFSVAAEALLSGRRDAVSWFPEGSYFPAMVFVGDPAPPPPPSPPTREVTELESGTVKRGEIPVVAIPGRWQTAAPPKPQAREEPRARGQPP